MAIFEGSDSNVPRNVLNKHSFTSYTFSSNNSLKCTNKFSIATGRDRESDESYRFRLSNIFQAREIGHATSIRLSALSVPGVTNIKNVNTEQGPGTFSIYVQSSTPTTSPSLLGQVSLAIQSVSPAGVKAFVLAPEPLGLEFIATITFSANATKQDISQAYIDMRDAAEDFISNLNIGDSLLIRDLIDTMIFSNRYVLSIGDEKPNSFDNIYMYRVSSFSPVPDRSEFFGTEVVPLYNERIILETNTRHRGIKFINRKQ
jgi:hypothetical protein